MVQRAGSGRRALIGLTMLVMVAWVAGVAGVPAASASGVRVTITPWLSGLNAPRGVAFDGAGNFFVAQSGLAGSGPEGFTHTGVVSRYQLGSSTPTWQTSTSSVFATEDPTQPPDVLGPEGVSASGPGCAKNNTGCQVLVIMSESHAGTGTGGQTGELLSFGQASGAFSEVANVGDKDYHFTAHHTSLFPPDFPDANPFAVFVTSTGRTFVADAGANTIDEVMPGGKIRIVSYIPNETSGALRDSTPTCIAQAPNGMLFVGTLDLLSNFAVGGGFSNVWLVNPDASFPTAPRLYATGLTTVTACTTDKFGNLWLAEMFGPTGSPPFGDIARIKANRPDLIDRFGVGGAIPLPGGIAVGPDGLYVSTNSAAPGPAGGVIRVRITSP